MKITFISREGYNLAGGRVRCYSFAAQLKKLGWRTEVLSFSDVLGAKDGEKECRMGLSEKIAYNWRAFKRLRKDKEATFFIQRFNYHSFAPYLAHMFNKNKIILDLDDWEIRENPQYLLGFWPSSKAHFFTKQLAKSSVICIAASRFLQDFLSQFNKKVYLIPTGVDTELFRPSLGKLNKNKITFTWIGTFHKKEYIHNLKFAIDCFMNLRRKYNHIYFEIAGDGIYKDKLQEIINQSNDQHILLKEWIHPEDMPKYLDSIDIGLLPIVENNKFNKAKSPTKLFEYMAMAKPTVSCDIGESRYIIKDGENGFLAKNKIEFIAKMEMLIKDSNLSKQMGEKARETVQNQYSLKVLGSELYRILKTL